MYLVVNNNQLRNIIQSDPDKAFRVLKRVTKTTVDGESGEEAVIEGPVGEDEIVQSNDIIQALESEDNTTAEIRVVPQDSDGESTQHEGKYTVELKFTKKSTVMQSCCKINKVVLVIVAFLALATAVFILFFVYVFEKKAKKK